jgi:hypothetical protein
MGILAHPLDAFILPFIRKRVNANMAYVALYRFAP